MHYPSITRRATQTGAERWREQMTKPGPLRLIVDRPAQMLEALECGHVIPRPLGLGEDAMTPSTVKRRRCWKCEEMRRDASAA